MKYFVIGGGGFIGSVLVEKLLAGKGNRVTVYDNFSSGKLDHLKRFREDKNFFLIKGDILSPFRLKQAMKGIDFVFHLAANPDIRLGTTHTRLDFEINTVGTLNVLEAMVTNHVEMLAFASTSAVFGTPSKLPTPEDYGPCLPESLYGASKLACEGFVSAYSHLFGLKAWIFRFANITGSPATHGIIFDFHNKIIKNPTELEVLGDGNQAKSYVTNDMLIDAMELAIRKTLKSKEKVLVYNIGNEDRISVKDITKKFLEENKIKPKVRFTGGPGGWKGDIPIMDLDISKIRNLGWKPNKTSKECIIGAIRQMKV
jgi:UDP-glucose 4-epimerase